MKHWNAMIVACLAAMMAILPARAATPAQVDAAVEKAIKYIYSQQQNGNWELAPARANEEASEATGWQWGGITSLATCSLLYARESPQDPRLKEAVQWLMNAEIAGIYALGFRCQVWQMVPNVEGVRKIAHEDKQFLLEAVHKRGVDRQGHFPYAFYAGKHIRPDWYDHSVSQYGVLAMWALQQMNLEVPENYWKFTEAAWKRHQNEDGGWSYRFRDGDAASSVTMTAAGLATLFITQDYVHAMQGLGCTGNYKDVQLERALAWMAANFGKFRERHPYYALYGCERVGVASGYKYFGNIDWYQVGADFLVENQREDGSWGGDDEHYNPKHIADTAFAIMFLVRGRAPVMMNKLDYSIGEAGENAKPVTWNQRPREVANITRWVGKQIEKDLNWQIVNLRATAADLHDAPILWISGREALALGTAEEAKLKAFVEQGGIILGHADCGSLGKAFADSFKKLGQKLFPYEFKELAEDHAIYTSQQYRRSIWKRPPSVLALSNGARVLMLLIPQADAGKGWQTQAFQGIEREPLAQLMANIFLYSVDKKNLRNKGETYLVEAKAGAPANKTVKVARLQYSGNWDPEPGGWKRLANIMRHEHQVAVVAAPVQISKLNAGGYSIAHMTGTTKFSLSSAEQEELKKFVNGGGTLVVDAAGGVGEFAIAAEGAMTATFKPAKGFPVLKADHPAIKGGEVEYRAAAKKVLGNMKTPRLRGLDVGGRTTVFLSQEDLSVGLVGQPVDGIYGYEPKTATMIMANILLGAAK